MNSQIITIIVPRMFPAVDGLGDYGLALAKKMRSDYGLDAEFIVADPSWSGEKEVEGFKVTRLKSRSQEDLESTLKQKKDLDHTIVLHYVGYGYAKRGCPGWLIKALENWIKKSSTHKLITMMHELYAFGPIWTSQFWTSPYQRYLAKKLALISHQCLTSKNKYADILNLLAKNSCPKIIVLPVFSNIGELEQFEPIENRKRTLIIFGGKGPRSRVYNNSKNDLEIVCKKFDINEILDIGPLIDLPYTYINNINIQSLGIKNSDEISGLLSSALIGFINYPPEYLCKSGIFAAYCAHKVLPIVSWNEKQSADGVIENFHYLNAKDINKVLDKNSEAKRIIENAHNWYQEHNLSVHSKTFYQLLDKKRN